MTGKARRVGSALLSVLAVLLLCTACFTLDAPDPNASSPTGPPPSYLDRLKSTKTVEPTSTAAKTLSEGVQGFLSPGHNIACVFTSSRGGHVNNPLEPNDYGNSRNQPYPIVPVVQCELSSYQPPAAKDVKDNCAGTGIGYLGGVVLLSPKAVQYGACRAGLTGMESSAQEASTAKAALAEFPSLDAGLSVDAMGYRCAPLDAGVACANLSNGVGFFVSEESYQLFGTPAK